MGVPLLLKERCSTAIQLNRVSGLGKVATTLCSLIHNGEHKMQNSAVALRGRMGSGLKPRTKTEASEILSRGSFVDCLAPHIHLKSDMSPWSCLFEYLALGWCYRLWNLWDVKSVWSRWVTGYGPLRLTLPLPLLQSGSLHLGPATSYEELQWLLLRLQFIHSCHCASSATMGWYLLKLCVK